MKVKISNETFLNEYQECKDLCLKCYGKGTFSLGFLASEVDKLKFANTQMLENCNTTTKIDEWLYGTQLHRMEVKTVTLSEEYKKNQQLICALEFLINILVFKNLSIFKDYELGLIDELPVITLKDFEFTDEEVLLFASKKGDIYPKYKKLNKGKKTMCLRKKKIKNQGKKEYRPPIDPNPIPNYSLGSCPFCDGQGILYVAKDINSKPYIICDECSYQYDTIEDAKNKKVSQRNGYTYVPLEEAVELGYGDYIYVVRNNKPEKLIK